LHRLADLIEENAQEFARRGTLDNGMPMSNHLSMVPLASAWTRYYAGWADKIPGEVTASCISDGELGYALYQPYGVIGSIITWNGPMVSLGMKIPAALAAGNTVLNKPAKLTPFSGDLFQELILKAGFPPGVVNTVLGGATDVVGHPLVKKISFTGGAGTARKILKQCAENLKPSCMELGGKSASIIFDDYDLDVACLNAAIFSIGYMSGQGCAFPTRLLVQKTIYDEVVGRIAGIAKSFKVGDPFEADTVVGPVVNEDGMLRILSMIEKAKQDGSRLVAGGNRAGGAIADGFFIEPTVFADVDPDSELAQEEVFGPVLAVIPFSTEEEAIKIANNSKYGLSAYIRTNNMKRALRVAEELDTGEVMINGTFNLHVNRPFGGWKTSGTGKEGGRWGIEEFMQIKGIGIGLGNS
jgi:aldehyde dehydrogenase (NAD+)